MVRGAVSVGLLLLAGAVARAVPGDADNSQDYPGFPRPAGLVISDYAEDNPAEADFPVARPLPLDANHVEMVHVKGHRFVIRYELATGTPLTVYQTQRYYEKLAAAGRYQIVKDGGVGDVSETYCRGTSGHDTWVSLEPCNNVTVLTVIEAAPGTTPLPGMPPRLAAIPTRPPSAMLPTPRAGGNQVTPVPATSGMPAIANEVTPVPTAPASREGKPPVVTAGPSTPSTPEADGDGNTLYEGLMRDGRIVVPFVFQPGKDELDAASQPLVDRVAAMMIRHGDLFLRIEGHTDNSGDAESNLRLSAQRAIAVEARLIAANVDKGRLDAVGVGGLQPLADNNTAEGREKNRRVELVLWKRYSHRTPSPPETSANM